MIWKPRFTSPGALVHAVPGAEAHGRALCGMRPAYKSPGWQSNPDAEVTCPRCVREIVDAAEAEVAEMSRANVRLIEENAALRDRLNLPADAAPAPAERRRAAPRGKKPQEPDLFG